VEKRSPRKRPRGITVKRTPCWSSYVHRQTVFLRKTPPDASPAGLAFVGAGRDDVQCEQHSQLMGAFAKAVSRRLKTAFAKLNAVVLLEVGLHNPLALALGRQDKSEWALALGLLAQLPKTALLLADRLYGCAAIVDQVPTCCTGGAARGIGARSEKAAARPVLAARARGAGEGGPARAPRGDLAVMDEFAGPANGPGPRTRARVRATLAT